MLLLSLVSEFFSAIQVIPLEFGTNPKYVLLILIPHDVGTTKIKNLDDNIGSLRLKLTKEDLEEICDVVPQNEVAGARAIEKLLSFSWRFADTPPPRV